MLCSLFPYDLNTSFCALIVGPHPDKYKVKSDCYNAQINWSILVTFFLLMYRLILWDRCEWMLNQPVRERSHLSTRCRQIVHVRVSVWLYRNIVPGEGLYRRLFDGYVVCDRVPTRTGKPGKPGKMGRHFPVREKSGNFEQTGKVREKSGKITQNTGKVREFEINIIWYFYILFLVIFKWTVYCLLKWIKFSVKKTKH